jgi:hypothetical protein
VGRARRDGDVVSELCVDGLAFQAVEAQCALGDEEGFVVLICGGVSFGYFSRVGRFVL